MATSEPHSAGLDSGCGSRIGFINGELGTSFASADPAGCSHSFVSAPTKAKTSPGKKKAK